MRSTLLRVVATAVTVATIARPSSAQVWEIDPDFAPIFHETSPGGATFIPLPDQPGWLVTGYFDTVTGRSRDDLAKFSATLSLDSDFAPQAETNDVLTDSYEGATPLLNGRVLVSINRNRPSSQSTVALLVVLDAGGNTSTAIELEPPSTTINSVRTFPTPDGGALASYLFQQPSPRTSWTKLARILPDGTVDPTFHYVGSPRVYIENLCARPDGSLFISGTDQNTPFLRKLRSDGSLDSSFTATLPAGAASGPLVVLNDGSVLLLSGPGYRFDAQGSAHQSGFAAEVPNGAVFYSAAALTNGSWVGQYRHSPADNGWTRARFFVGVFAADGSVVTDLTTANGQPRTAELLGVSPDDVIVIRRAIPVRVPTKLSNSGGGGGEVETPLSTDHPPIGADRSDASSDQVEWQALEILALTPAGQVVTTSPERIELHTRPQTLSVQPSRHNEATWLSGPFDIIDGSPAPSPQRFLASGVRDPQFQSTIKGTPLLELMDGRIIVETTVRSATPGDDDLYRLENRWLALRLDGSIDQNWAPPAELPRLHETQGTTLFTSDENGRIYGARWKSDGLTESDLEIFRLLPNGQQDATWSTPRVGQILGFDANGSRQSSSADLPLLGMAALADGRLQVTGMFKRINDLPSPGNARLRHDGSVDSLFGAQTPGDDSVQLGYAAARDGSALAYRVSRSTGETAYSTLRWRPDGTIDEHFSTWPEWPVYTFAMQQPDGTYLQSRNRWFATGLPDRNWSTIATTHALNQSATASADVVFAIAGAFQSGGARLHRFEAHDELSATIYPQSQTVVVGDPLWLQTTLETRDIVSLSWTLDGRPLPDQDAPLLRLDPVRLTDGGHYTCTIVTTGGQTITTSADVTVEPNTSRLVNLSSRGRIAPGRPIVAGFVLAGDQPNPMLLRVVGQGIPGISRNETVPATVLRLYAGSEFLQSNEGGVLSPEIMTLGASLGAFPPWTNGIPSGATAGSALAPQLSSRPYTVHAASADQRAGIALTEIYDAGGPTTPSRVRNLSIRGTTAPGNDVLTAGFVVQGNGLTRLLLRAVGPGLTAFNVNNVISSAHLSLYRSGYSEPIFKVLGQSIEAQNAASQVGAFELATNSLDSALIATLLPGAYTVQVPVPAGTTAGEALLEIYLLEPGDVSTN